MNIFNLFKKKEYKQINKPSKKKLGIQLIYGKVLMEYVLVTNSDAIKMISISLEDWANYTPKEKRPRPYIYTGVFDSKRQQKIFEGHIIKLSYVLYPKKKPVICEVKWLDGKMGFRAVNGRKDFIANFANKEKYKTEILSHEALITYPNEQYE